MSFNILLVDDSATTRGVMKKIFRLANVPIEELHEASNGREALDMLKEHWIDVVFTDINMPVMDGVELVERMSQDGLLKTVPVVMVTIEGSTTRLDQLRSKGVSAFIRKPFTPEIIQNVLNEVLWPCTHVLDKDALGKVFIQVLERLAFTFAEVMPKDKLPPFEEGGRLLAIDFKGRVSGNLELAMSDDLGRLIAANILGIELEDNAAATQSDDSLKELINVTCGQMLTAIAGEQPVFDMSTPSITALTPALWTSLKDDADSLAFSAEEHVILLRLKLEERRG